MARGTPNEYQQQLVRANQARRHDLTARFDELRTALPESVATANRSRNNLLRATICYIKALESKLTFTELRNSQLIRMLSERDALAVMTNMQAYQPVQLPVQAISIPENLPGDGLPAALPPLRNFNFSIPPPPPGTFVVYPAQPPQLVSGEQTNFDFGGMGSGHLFPALTGSPNLIPINPVSFPMLPQLEPSQTDDNVGPATTPETEMEAVLQTPVPVSLFSQPGPSTSLLLP